jgi:hypothetical protein
MTAITRFPRYRLNTLIVYLPLETETSGNFHVGAGGVIYYTHIERFGPAELMYSAPLPGGRLAAYAGGVRREKCQCRGGEKDGQYARQAGSFPSAGVSGRFDFFAGFTQFNPS